jgi:adenylate kinase
MSVLRLATAQSVSRRFALELILIGPQGSGKGTQGGALADWLAVPHVVVGDLLREARDPSSLGRRIATYVQAGRLVPDPVVAELVERRLTQPDTSDGFVLDGFPRTRPQAELLQSRPASSTCAVIHLDVPVAVLTERLAARRVCARCGRSVPPSAGERCEACAAPLVRRSDDNPAAVRTRLDTYDRQTRPLLEWFRQRCPTITVDGNAPPDDVGHAIRASLEGVGIGPHPPIDLRVADGVPPRTERDLIAALP